MPDTSGADTPAARIAAAAGRTLSDGRRGIRFDPRDSGAYDPTRDLDELQIPYEVAVVRAKTTGRAWYEARFTGPA